MNQSGAIVREIMNPRLLYVCDGDRTTLVRAQILKFGVTGVPVLDEAHRPVGFISLRDLADDDERVHVSCPAVTVRDTETIEEAAKRLAASTLHHLVVVDAGGVAVGMVSALDLLRALAGVPSQHPARFDSPAVLPPDER